MVILNQNLDAEGQAIVDLRVQQTLPRRLAFQAAGQNVPPRITTTGIIDTGSRITLLDTQLARNLHLVPFRVRALLVPSSPGPISALSYKIDLEIHFGHKWRSFKLLSVFLMPLSHMGVHVMVGCDVLKQCQFIHTGTDDRFSLAF